MSVKPSSRETSPVMPILELEGRDPVVTENEHFRKQRDMLKYQIEFMTKKLEESNYSVLMLSEQIECVEEKLSLTNSLNEKLNEYFCNVESSEYMSEINAQIEFHLQIKDRLSLLKNTIEAESSQRNDAHDMSKSQTFQYVKPHEIKLPYFNGAADSIQFADFLRIFNDVIGNRSEYTDSVKLIYLKTYLRGNAYDIIKHLSNQDANFNIAIEFLRKEYLDENVVIEKLLDTLTTLKSPMESDHQALNQFFHNVRAAVYELRNYQLDPMEENSFGCRLLSHILIKKLPSNFKLRLSLVINTDYPTVSQLLDHSSQIIRSLQKQELQIKPSTKVRNAQERNWRASGSQPARSTVQSFTTSFVAKGVPQSQKISTKSNSAPNIPANCQKSCKMCQGSHSMIQCQIYNTADKRVNRMSQLGLCTKCSGKHNVQMCPASHHGLTYPCTKCKGTNHITALCQTIQSRSDQSVQNNLCLLTNGDTLSVKSLLPSISVLMFKEDGKSEIVRCLVDPGSQASYISQNLAEKLQLVINESTSLDVRTFIGHKPRKFGLAKCGIHVTPRNKVVTEFLVDSKLDLDYEVPGVCSLIKILDSQGYRFADSFYRDIENDLICGFECLLGSDILENLAPLHTVCVNGSVVYEVPDGLVLFGNPQRMTSAALQSVPPMRRENQHHEVSTTVNLLLSMEQSHQQEEILSDEFLDDQLKKMFTLEGVGIKEDECQTDHVYVEQFDNSIEQIDGKYAVKIPFTDRIDEVPSAFDAAKASLNRVQYSLSKKGMTNDYTKVFQDLLSREVIEEKVSDDYEKCIYIPHHPIIKSDDRVTTKIRPVFNCSFKRDKTKPSLNEACFQGLDLLNSLIELLVKFRNFKFTIIADIEKAFLQILLKTEEDKNRFCFLWEQDGELKIYRFRTLTFGLNCSPFILNRVLLHHFSKFRNCEIANILQNHLYVDNLIYSTSNKEQLVNIYEVSRKIMSSGGFNLRSWTTNDSDLLNRIKSDGLGTEHVVDSEKLLGYQYDPQRDVLYLADFQFSSNNPTKRSILSDVSRIYDPLSLTVPVSISGRLLMKRLWSLGVEWDEALSDDICQEWLKLRDDLLKLKQLTFSRMAVDVENNDVDLNVFTDGSQSAYGFCCYAVAKNQSALVFSKSRVAPEKRSIPQLELLAVNLAFTSLLFLLECFPTVKTIHMWIDSQVVLSWLENGCKTKNRFTINRVKEATGMCVDLKRERNVVTEFHYVESSQNPADLVTRGISFKRFKEKEKFWVSGPKWICDQTQWPNNSSIVNMCSENVLCLSSTLENDKTESVIDVQRYSSLCKLIRITNYVFRFVCKLKRRQMNVNEPVRYLIRQMQSETFQPELQNIKQGGVTPLIRDLNLFVDEDGIIRAKGRLNKLNSYSYGVLNPILLAKGHHLTKLIVQEAHLKCKHLGIGTTLACVRLKGYWIPAGRQVVKTIIQQCVTCTKMNAFAFNYPKMTNLPKERLRLIKPFLHTAVDYAGPLHVFDSSGNSAKVYIVLYTCLAIRAVHLDLVNDLTAKSFVGSFKKFCNSTTVPESVYSDNATYFKAGMSFIKNAFLSDEFQSHISSLSIRHDTIPAFASWVGGIYERQIRTMKQCLFKSIGRSKLTASELLIHLSEIQTAINNRPITYLHSDINEITALTPNMLLNIHSNPHLQLSDITHENDPLWSPRDDINPTQEELEETFKRQLRLFENFRTIWYSSYILSLREYTRDTHQVEWENRVRVNDIVLVSTKDQPRVHWLLGRVIKLLYSDDGKVRSALLQMPHKAKAQYAINHLYPLEIQAVHEGTDTPSVVDRSQNKKERPVRQTSRAAGQMVKRLIETNQL